MMHFAFLIAVNTYVDLAARRFLLFKIKMRFFTRDINRLNKLMDIIINSIRKLLLLGKRTILLIEFNIDEFDHIFV